MMEAASQRRFDRLFSCAMWKTRTAVPGQAPRNSLDNSRHSTGYRDAGGLIEYPSSISDAILRG
jgi:hypothetical protein